MIDGGMVSSPFIKNSSYVKVAFMNRGYDTIPPSTGIFPTHIINQVVAIMSLGTAGLLFSVKGFISQLQIIITYIIRTSS